MSQPVIRQHVVFSVRKWFKPKNVNSRSTYKLFPQQRHHGSTVMSRLNYAALSPWYLVVLLSLSVSVCFQKTCTNMDNMSTEYDRRLRPCTYLTLSSRPWVCVFFFLSVVSTHYCRHQFLDYLPSRFFICEKIIIFSSWVKKKLNMIKFKLSWFIVCVLVLTSCHFISFIHSFSVVMYPF